MIRDRQVFVSIPRLFRLHRIKKAKKREGVEKRRLRTHGTSEQHDFDIRLFSKSQIHVSLICISFCK